MTEPRYTLDAFNSIPADREDGRLELHVVTLEEFAAVEEEGATALLGLKDSAVIPAGGNVMVYGDGGAGKTTLVIDLACYLAAGDDWLGVHVETPLRVLLVENEGPRPFFRRKLDRKREAWRGSPLGGRVQVLEEPWAELSFEHEEHREVFAATIRELEIDVVVIGPLNQIGMNEAGTIQETRDFAALLRDARVRSGRPVAFVIVHHENRAGRVSGVWEPHVETMIHVQAQGNGRTRLHFEKARWSSEHHKTSLQLLWADGESFTADETPERDNDTIADDVLAYVRANGGTPWTKVALAVEGRGERLREIRDRLLVGERLINAGSEARTKLWHVDDPALPPTAIRESSRAGRLRDDSVVPHGGNGYEAESSRRPALSRDDGGTTPLLGTPAQPNQGLEWT